MPQTAFAVIYRWRVHPDKEPQFREAWRRLTHSIRELRGSHGSRLHRDDTGAYVAIALWPSREAWAATTPALPDGTECLALMRESTEMSFPALLLTVVDDLWFEAPPGLPSPKPDEPTDN